MKLMWRVAASLSLEQHAITKSHVEEYCTIRPAISTKTVNKRLKYSTFITRVFLWFVFCHEDADMVLKLLIFNLDFKFWKKVVIKFSYHPDRLHTHGLPVHPSGSIQDIIHSPQLDFFLFLALIKHCTLFSCCLFFVFMGWMAGFIYHHNSGFVFGAKLAGRKHILWIWHLLLFS